MNLLKKNKVVLIICLCVSMIFVTTDLWGKDRRKRLIYYAYLILEQPDKGLVYIYMINKTRENQGKVYITLRIKILDFINDSCYNYLKDINIKDFRQHFSRELNNFIKLVRFSHRISKLPLLRKKVTDEELSLYEQLFVFPKPSKIMKQDFIIGYEIYKRNRGSHSGGKYKYLNHNYGKTEEEYIKEGWIIERWIRKRFYKLGYAAVEELRKFDYKRFFELEGFFTEGTGIFCKYFYEEIKKNNNREGKIK
ncbi:MAG: hypothetical protein KatS3mg035_2270 [Bacteroidia bacterium]|nr:MAG: hypothetical protein KatS3mg035_2270 [Bacteroidia bacterium]